MTWTQQVPGPMRLHQGQPARRMHVMAKPMGPHCNKYNEWWSRHAFILVPAQAYAANLLATFRESPPRQKPASFNLDEVMCKMEKSPTGG
ncbi:MAG: hypothetical protein R6W92_11225 [Desulfocurvibacter africanus]